MKKLQMKSLLGIIVVLAGLFLISCQQPKTLVEKPENTITPEEARELQQYYIATRAAILKDTLKYEDVRDVTFTIKELKEYIAYVEQELGSNLTDASQMRIFFGAYAPSKDREFGLSTVFIAPVQERGEKTQNGSFFGLNLQGGGVPPLNKGTGGQPPNDY